MIPWTAIKDYADECQLDDPDRREMLFEIIREIDVWYMDRIAAKTAKETAKGKLTHNGK